ncbi:hypothetical protein [Flavobacterium mesophilum]|uniref:hypothetical protein n=1 Tax=Flavobacterium mesophilum TaxID=3143495 RepID=UPI0031E08E96
MAEKFEKDLNDSIAKYKAVKFNYYYDGLVPQTSYLVGSKVKFLKYSHGPENSLNSSIVYFNDDGSIEKIIRRNLSFITTENSFQIDNAIDTTTVILVHPKKKTIQYAQNKIVDSTFNQLAFEQDNDFIYRMKLQTEKKHNTQ